MLTLVMSIADIMDKKEKILALYDRYYPLMCYVAQENLPPEHHSDIDDIVQESLLDIMNYIDNIDIDDDVRSKTLCILIVKRRSIDHARKKDNLTISLEELYTEIGSNEIDPDIMLDQLTTLEIIAKAIGDLNDNYRDVCRLRYICQKSEKEIAKLLDLTPKAVNMRIMRGKTVLRNILRKELYGE